MKVLTGKGHIGQVTDHLTQVTDWSDQTVQTIIPDIGFVYGLFRFSPRPYPNFPTILPWDNLKLQGG